MERNLEDEPLLGQPSAPQTTGPRARAVAMVTFALAAIGGATMMVSSRSDGAAATGAHEDIAATT